MLSSININNATFIFILAKNLKEIVDSVQEELVKKLEQLNEEQKIAAQAMQSQKEMKENNENAEWIKKEYKLSS